MLDTQRTHWRTLGLLGLAVGATVAASRAGGDRKRKRPLRPAPRGTLTGARARIVIDRHAAEIHAAFRRLADLPRWLLHLASVVERSDGVIRWTARLPGGSSAQWETVLVENPSRSIAWNTPDASAFVARGSVRFDELPHGRGTLVAWTVVFERTPTGSVLARLARRELESALRRFKQHLEAGEIATAGPTSGRQSPATSGHRRPERSEQVIDLALEDTFPASDPPAVP